MFTTSVCLQFLSFFSSSYFWWLSTFCSGHVFPEVPAAIFFHPSMTNTRVRTCLGIISEISPTVSRTRAKNLPFSVKIYPCLPNMNCFILLDRKVKAVRIVLLRPIFQPIVRISRSRPRQLAALGQTGWSAWPCPQEAVTILDHRSHKKWITPVWCACRDDKGCVRAHQVWSKRFEILSSSIAQTWGYPALLETKIEENMTL